MSSLAVEMGEEWETRLSKRRDTCSSKEGAETAEERERHACPGAVLESRIHAYSMYILSMFCYTRFSFLFLMHGKKSTSLWICHVHIRQTGTSFSSGTQLNHILIHVVG